MRERKGPRDWPTRCRGGPGSEWLTLCAGRDIRLSLSSCSGLLCLQISRVKTYKDTSARCLDCSRHHYHQPSSPEPSSPAHSHKTLISPLIAVSDCQIRGPVQRRVSSKVSILLLALVSPPFLSPPSAGFQPSDPAPPPDPAAVRVPAPPKAWHGAVIAQIPRGFLAMCDAMRPGSKNMR